MPKPSTIDTLPPELRTAFDRFLASRKDLTIDDVTAWLNEQLADSGVQVSVSRSAVGRYRKTFEEAAAKIRESREIAAAFAREVGAAPDGNLGAQLVELVRGLAFKIATNSDAKQMDFADLAKLAKSVKDVEAGAKLSIEAEAKVREQVRKELEEEAKRNVRTAVGDGRMDPEAAEEAMRIMGFV
jgi:hypothetical protein